MPLRSRVQGDPDSGLRVRRARAARARSAVLLQPLPVSERRKDRPVRRCGLDLPFFFNRKEEKDHGEGGVFVGYVPKAGERVVIVEDVITAGTAIRESMANLSHLEGVDVAAVFVMVDRKEKGRGEKSAMAEIEEEFGFPVYSVVDVYDIIEYLEEDPKNGENVARIKNYLAVNGAGK